MRLPGPQPVAGVRPGNRLDQHQQRAGERHDRRHPCGNRPPDGDALHFNLLKPPPVKRVEPDPPWFTVGEETDIVVTNYSESKPGVGKVITLHIGVRDTKRHDGKTFEDEIPDDTQTLIITVINTPPRFTEMDPAREVAENVPLGTNVGTPLEVQNLEGDTLVWEISGSDFTVDESGQDELVRWPSLIAAVMDVPDAIEPSYEADAEHQRVLRRLPGHQHPPIARITVDTGVQTQAHDGVGNRGHRRPGQTEPDGGKDQGKQHEGRAVGHEDEAVEPGPDGDGGRYQGNVHGAEDEHPAPGHRPVRQQPEVDQSVERHQRHLQENVLQVTGVPGACMAPISAFSKSRLPGQSHGRARAAAPLSAYILS